MKRALALLLCPAIASLALAGCAQDAAAPAVAPPRQAIATAGLQARTLAPFSARYAVFRGGDPLGDATMQVVKLDGSRWRVDLSIRASHGLLRIAGLNLQQSTLFTVDGAGYRPLTQSTVRHALFSNKQTTGIYDWATHKAQWQGDVKKTRRAPVALQDGDMSGLLINLAVLRDAQPGVNLHYRFVDDGRVREHQYVVAQQREPQSVEDIGYEAMRVTRVHAGGDETVLWVVEGVPTPIRILQREGGEDTLDLRLVEYTGA